ncbi:hypothetical protein [Streptomyces sp.]|uniref:hypothetical protein n=1 Tax=Streptomyces sp. TaxID=1931 RepID=UPI002811FB58|nr:hypothetical protein [Streptomyces sp.]
MSGAQVQAAEVQGVGPSPGPLTADEVGPLRDLLTIAADVVEMLDDGRVEFVSVSASGQVTVHVSGQGDAEHLAWRLGLGTVTEYAPRDGRRGFTVWSGGDWPAPRFEVFCNGNLVRPVRAFPRPSGLGRVA